MIYTLILTATFYAYGGYRTVLHSEHDYSSRHACQQAYSLARAQLYEDARTVAGVCLASYPRGYAGAERQDK